MNIQNLTAPKNRTRGTLAIGAALVGILTLAGCAPSNPAPTPTTNSHSATPTPTPTPTGVPAPTSEEGALTSAKTTIAGFLKVRGEVNASGGTDTTPLQKIATGPALTIAQQDAGRIVSDKNTTSGALKFEFQSGYASDLVGSNGTKYPFSSVNITGCQDASDYKILNADGTPAQRPTSLRNVINFVVIWDPSAKEWLVQNALNGGATC